MRKSKKLVIIGTGETARLAYEYFTHDSNYVVVAFAVNEQYIKDSTFCNLPVVALELLHELYNQENYHTFVALASGRLNRDRQKMFEYMKLQGFTCASYISSKAFIWHDVKIGENCFILENNVLQSGVILGNNVTLWSGNHIGHLSNIKNNVFISSHVVISGFCEVGSNTFIGVNSSVADGIKIAYDNFIAMGTVINKNTEENGFYIGSPAVKKNVSAKKFCKVTENVDEI